MASNWSYFKQSLLSFCRSASPRELTKNVSTKTLYIAINGRKSNGRESLRGGIASYHMFEDLVSMLPRVKDDDDKILAPMVVAAIVNGARFKSLCDTLLELEGHDGVGAY